MPSGITTIIHVIPSRDKWLPRDFRALGPVALGRENRLVNQLSPPGISGLQWLTLNCEGITTQEIHLRWGGYRVLSTPKQGAITVLSHQKFMFLHSKKNFRWISEFSKKISPKKNIFLKNGIFDYFRKFINLKNLTCYLVALVNLCKTNQILF